MKIHHHSLIRRITSPILKTLGILVALYLFICSLTFLSTSFRILGGRNLSKLFSNSELLNNPIVGIMIGILVTVAVQSSATSTSIIGKYRWHLLWHLLLIWKILILYLFVWQKKNNFSLERIRETTKKDSVVKNILAIIFLLFFFHSKNACNLSNKTSVRNFSLRNNWI